MKLCRSIKDVRSYELYRDCLIINWATSKKVSIVVKDDFQKPIELEITTEGLSLYQSYLFCPGMHIVDLDSYTLMEKIFTDCFFEMGYGDKVIVSRYDRRSDTSTLGLLDLGTWQLDDIGTPLKGGIVSGEGEYIITNDSTRIYCYDDFSPVWEDDLSLVGSYMDIFGKKQEGTIYRGSMKVYRNKLIVVIGKTMRAYELSSGNMVWELVSEKGPFGLYLLIDGDNGYSTDSLGYWGIDLKTGACMSGPVILKDIILKNKTIIPSGRQMVIKDGLLWHSISDNGVNIIAAVNPATGDYVWHQPIEAKGWIHAPRFHGNKMFVLTSEKELLIFEAAIF